MVVTLSLTQATLPTPHTAPTLPVPVFNIAIACFPVACYRYCNTGSY